MQEPAKARAAVPHGIGSEDVARETPQESRQRYARFQTRQIDPGTGVNAESERQMPVRFARDIQSVGLGELRRIAVGGADTDGDARIRRKPEAADLDIRGGDAVAELDRAFIAEELLDRRLHRFRVPVPGDQSLLLVGPFAERMQRAADEIGRRLVTGVEQEDALMQELGLGKRIAPVLADDEARQYIGVRVAQVCAALVDEGLEVGLAARSSVSTGSSAPRISSDQPRKGPRSSCGTPSRLPMMPIGIAAAKSSIRSTSRFSSIAASKPSNSLMRPGSMAAICRWLVAPTIARRTRVCSGGSLKIGLDVWCSKRGVAPYLAPNSFFLSELNALKSRYTGTMSSQLVRNQEPAGMCVAGSRSRVAR